MTSHTTLPVSTIMRLVKAVSFLTAGLLLAAFIVANRGAAIFDFRFNPYALLSFISIVANLVLLFLMYRQKERPPEAMWFCLFVWEITLWGGLEALQRLSATSEGAIFWYSLTPYCWVPLGVTLFMYALTMDGQGKAVSNSIGLFLVAVPLLAIVLTQRSDLIVHYYSQQALVQPWGIYAPYGTYFLPLLVWLDLFLILALFIMYHQYRQANDRTRKRRALYNIIGLLVPVIGGSISDGILPAMHIQALPVAILLTTAMALIIGYAAIRFKIFSSNPVLLADNILASMSETVLILDKKFEIEYVNPSSQQFLGYAPEQLIGGNLSKLVSAEDYDHLIEQLGSSMDTVKITKERYEILNSQSQKVPSLLTVDPIATADSPRAGYLVVATDMSTTEKITKEKLQLEQTKRAMLNALEDAQALEHELEKEKASVDRKIIQRTEQLSREQARLQASINSLQVGFMITDEKQNLLSANTAARAILGHKDASTIAAITAGLDASIDLKAKIAQCLKSRKPVAVREVLIGQHYVQVFITPILLDSTQAIGAVVLLQDVSEEKALQRSRDEFFSIASHELRTPLTAIRGNTSMIKTYYADELAKNQPVSEIIDDIHSSSIRLIEIVNDFLDVSRLEQGGIEFKLAPVDVSAIAESVTTEMAAVAGNKHIKLHNKIGKQPLVLADADRLKQIIYNLLGNALKFTEKGTITVSSRIEGKLLHVQITDTGPGIPLDKQHLLFHKFQQAGSSILTRDTTRGTGLGLYISKLLIEKMGGHISLDSSVPGKGSTFGFTIPLAAAADKKKAESKTDSKPSK